MIKEELEIRHLPKLLVSEDGTKVETVPQWEHRREEIVEILDNFLIGIEPQLKPHTEGKIERTDENAMAGKAVYHFVDVEVDTLGGFFQFPIHMILPKHVEKPPMFFYLSFEPALVNEFCPVEEILDNGYGIVSMYYQDIAPDTDSRFLTGAARLAPRNNFNSWGTIGMWAWAGHRVMDYLQTQSDLIDTNRIAVVGHSRLGKTSLWCGATDPRFSMVITNDSGGAGSALFRGKKGEMIMNLKHGSSKYWYCGNFLDYARNERQLPFDQHFVMALVAPRYLYVSSAEQDEWADPRSEFLGAMASNEAYELLGEKGLVAPDRFPVPGDTFHEGKIGYHMRPGTHFLSRYDWEKFMDYRKLHGC